MKKIPTFIVNLPQSTERKAYMERILAPFDFLDIRFMEAVYGRALTEEELTQRFDAGLAYKRYGRELERGEIGCSLSHFECYHRLVESGENFCLILEDDITLLRDFSDVQRLIPFIDCEEPRVLLLSGDYWFTRRKPIDADYRLADVFAAVGTYAYFINRAAARVILESNPRCANAADDWVLLRRQGFKMKAVFPYMVDANIESFDSEINQSHFGELKRNMPLAIRLRAYWTAALKKYLVMSSHFVSKIRKKE